MSKDSTFIQCQLVEITSAPSWVRIKRGRRVTKKAILTAFVTFSRAQLWPRVGEGKVVRRG